MRSDTTSHPRGEPEARNADVNPAVTSSADGRKDEKNA